MDGALTSVGWCEVCYGRTNVEVPAVAWDDDGRCVCLAHAPQALHDKLTTIREMTGFITWHEERAAQHDGAAAETRKPRSQDKNRAMALAHRKAADAIRDAIRREQAAPRRRG